MSSAVYQISVRERHEILCQRQLAVMNRVFKQWQKLNEQQRNKDAKTDQFIAAHRKLVEHSQRLYRLKSRELISFNQKMESFIASLNGEMRQIREQVIEEQAAQSRSQFHRQRNLAGLITLLQQQAPNETALMTELQRASSLDQEQLANLTFRAISLIENLAQVPSTHQSELLKQLKAQSDSKNVFWHSGVPQTPFSMQCEQIALMIEKVKILAGEQQVIGYSETLADIELMPEGTQRHVRADSLIMTIAAQLRDSQKRIELMERLEQVSDELNSFNSTEFTLLSQQASQLSSNASIMQIEQLTIQIEAAIAQLEQQIITQAQRTIVLEGLSKLGYEVRDSSVASWLANGQVVVTHPATPGYGLELGGKQARFQARTVAFSSQRDTQRDHDVDAIWCHQHQQLQDIIAKSDAELTLDRALPAGSGEMKVIETANQENEQVHRVIEQTQYRTLNK
ncbi:hypothetical protein [Providencia stuartii]|uniref:hypothetical protein n=1 Tax=Providencia stuartii TaxID=588 RepID=UPI00111D9CB1|nr:hypothetical protein [Providencia stuartii]